jgi:hypothetical protein
MDDISVYFSTSSNPIQNTQSQDKTSVIWVRDVIPHPNIDPNKSLVEEKQRLELFDWFQKEQFFILDGYIGSLSPSELLLYLPIFLYSEAKQYSEVFQNLKLDFSKKKYALNCCSNYPRPHRLVASCWLANYGSQFQFTHTQSWNQSDFLDQLDELLQIGSVIDYTHSFGPTVKMLDKSWKGRTSPKNYAGDTNNSINFEQNIKDLVDQSVFSLVLESGTWEKQLAFTEKYLNAIYGGTIPVLFGFGSYDIVENMGLDSFKDIINTSNQYEPNLVTRTWKILSDNATVFTHATELIKDPQIQKRIQNNLNIVKNYHDWLVKSILSCNSHAAMEKFLKIQNQIEQKLKWPLIGRISRTHYRTVVDEIITHRTKIN